MKSAIRNVLATAAVVLLASSAFAALSPEYADFGKGPAQYFMTADELAKWKTIGNDADAKAFIDLFWVRHDPTPGTPANEFKDAFAQREQLANKTFGYRRTPGSMTDRGRMLMVLGAPTEPVKQERIPALGGEGLNNADDTQQPNAPQPTGIRQTWTYDTSKLPKPVAAVLPASPLVVTFVDATGTGDFRFERKRGGEDFGALLDKAAQAYLTQPNITSLTEQTTTTTTKTTTVTQKPAAAATMTQLKTPALQAAIDQLKAGKNDLVKNAAVAYAELVSPAGDYYVPVQLYVPKSAGLTADAADTFFGVVEDASGTPVYAFEDAAKLIASKDDLFADKTLNLPTGKYTAYVGLAKAGQPVVLASKPLDLTTIGKDTAGVSKLILSNNIYETQEAAPVKAPFAFGKLKVVPKGDLVFSPKDDLWYFVELHNPGIDAATNLPKLQAKMSISGGKLKQPISAPLMEIQALPLSGTPGPGQYAIASSIPLSEMKIPLAPGEYKFTMRIIDGVSNQTYNLEQPFKIGS